MKFYDWKEFDIKIKLRFENTDLPSIRRQHVLFYSKFAICCLPLQTAGWLPCPCTLCPQPHTHGRFARPAAAQRVKEDGAGSWLAGAWPSGLGPRRLGLVSQGREECWSSLSAGSKRSRNGSPLTTHGESRRVLRSLPVFSICWAKSLQIWPNAKNRPKILPIL
jgi:hypothetical protein